MKKTTLVAIVAAAVVDAFSFFRGVVPRHAALVRRPFVARRRAVDTDVERSDSSPRVQSARSKA